MRIQDIFTIKSQYPKRGFYWIFKTSDPVCLVSYQGKVGEVSKDRPAMLAIDLPEVKVGFTETDSSFKKGWWAPPTVVKTDRLVLITKDGRIKQSEKDFPDKREYATVIFNDSFDAKMLDATRTLVLAGLGLIPEVGGAVKWVVGSVWPEQKPTVEDLISEAEARMKAWVHGKINDYERRELTSRLAGLRRNLEEYTRARDPGARKRWFDTCLALFNYSRDFFVKDTIEDYTPGTIELAFKLATMHLSLLRERVVIRPPHCPGHAGRAPACKRVCTFQRLHPKHKIWAAVC